ncbi:hypothetical protein E2C01_089880 [Portunus trituberculatus]|uniref:Uncharacterized protein n=1 Tax=Portunus trituberculatus TaxID=210409 RepID=A0A5B7JD85_PORTR|nr:hypothetical protein [Portunus trituberculatus]
MYFSLQIKAWYTFVILKFFQQRHKQVAVSREPSRQHEPPCSYVTMMVVVVVVVVVAVEVLCHVLTALGETPAS